MHITCIHARAGAASDLCQPSGLFAPLGMDSYFYSGCSENFIRNHSLVHFCDIFHSLRSWNISDNPMYFVIRRFASHDKLQCIIAGNDVIIFVSSVFTGDYYIKLVVNCLTILVIRLALLWQLLVFMYKSMALC